MASGETERKGALKESKLSGNIFGNRYLYAISTLSILSLLDGQAASIIEHSGYDSSEVAMSLFVISCFMTRDLVCCTKTIYIVMCH